MNKIIITGNLTHDPSLKQTNSGVNYCNFSMAVTRKFKDADGNRQTDFFNVTAWRTLAELIAKYLAKGKKCMIVGELQTEKYQAKDGTDRTAYKIIADEVEFLSPADKDGQGQPTQEPADPNQGMTPVSDDNLPF